MQTYLVHSLGNRDNFIVPLPPEKLLTPSPKPDWVKKHQSFAVIPQFHLFGQISSKSNITNPISLL